MKRFFTAWFAFLCIWAIALPALAGEAVSGTWNLETSSKGTPRLTLHTEPRITHNSNDLNVDPKLLPMQALAASQMQHVSFSIVREAGTYQFEGNAGLGMGHGTYTLTLNDSFFSDMRTLGYDTTSTGEREAFASLDITREYVDEMDRIGLRTTTSQMIAMRALAIDSPYVQKLRSSGISGLTVANIIAMRALNIDSSYIQYLRAHGIKDLSAASVIAMKAENI